MVVFIPLAIGAGLGVAAVAGAAGAAYKRHKNKKKRQHAEEQQRQSEQAQRRQRQTMRPRTSSPQREDTATRQRVEEHSQQKSPRPQPASEQSQHKRPQPLQLPPYDRQALVKALDQAVAKAASDTLDAALAKPPFNAMPSYDKKIYVARTADDMRSDLSRLRMPDYDNDITAAAYLLNYHPSHIGLAHAIVSQVAATNGKLSISNTNRLRIIDLAAGTLAMQFGIAIAVADALIRGEPISEVVVDSVDINPAMMRVGRIAWENFVLTTKSDKNLTALAESCRLIEPHRYVRHDTFPTRDGECWLSCLHGVYGENESALGQALRALHDKHSPTVGLMTCWGKPSKHQNIAIARGLAPFKGENWQAQPAYFLEKGAEYKVPFLFQDREDDALQTEEIGHRSGILPPSWSVFWRPTDTAVLTYQRKFSNYGH